MTQLKLVKPANNRLVKGKINKMEVLKGLAVTCIRLVL